MKKIGLVGGMGPESTIPYYHDIVYGVKKAMGRDFFPELTIESVNLFDVVAMLSDSRLEQAAAYLANAVNNLARAGAEVAALTANTAHIVYDRVQELSDIPLVNIITATADEAVRRQYRRVALLGTIFTMENDFFVSPMQEAGIEVVTPEHAQAETVSRLIYGELEHGIVNEHTQRLFVDLIDTMKRRYGIEAVILGCTELPMILNDTVSPVPCLDTRAIHIRRLIDIITS